MAVCKLGALDKTPDLTGAAAAVVARLNAEGVQVSTTTVKDHRAGRCACTRPTVADIIAPPADEPQAARRGPLGTVPDGWQPRAEYDTTTGGFIVTPAWEDGDPEPVEAELLAERGMDPARWQVTSVRYSEWQQSKRTESGDRDVVTLHAKRVNITPRPAGVGSVRDQDLVALLTGARRPAVKPGKGPAGVFVHAGGDYQLGKLDGDGVEGTVNRFMDALDYGRTRLAELRKTHAIDTVCLPHLGDCIEGYVSQGGRNRNRTSMGTGEQVDLLIHLLCEQVRHYAPLAEKIIVPVIPGNHDEEGRNPDTLEHQSWATFAAKQLQRVLRFSGSAYDHVRIVTPPAHELTLTLDLAGVPVGMGHGHYHGPGKLHDWLNDQAGGHQLVGEARIMLEAHHHHLVVSQRGVRTGVQVPALEGESRWWRHRKGEQSPPGMVTMLVGAELGRAVTLPDGLVVRSGWDHLAVA